jgi:proline dehydrogenase
MPGEHAEDALREGRRLQVSGIPTLVTCLGENVTTEAEATAVVDEYQGLGRAVRAAGLDMELSVKLTHLGLDQGVGLAARNLARIAEAAAGIVWVDMEGSNYVDRTLDAWREARAQHDNVGICLQAYLHRTERDFEEILPETPHIRLVKGAYMEPPDIAMAKKSTVDEAFRKLASRMLRERLAGQMGRPAIATHDQRLIGDAKRIAFEIGLAADQWEIDMLYGIAEQSQAALVRSGVPLRVLISYGSHWFPWYMRRLAERPANVGFVLRQMVSR